MNGGVLFIRVHSYDTVPAVSRRPRGLEWSRVTIKEGTELFTGAPWKTLKLAIFIFFKFRFHIWFQKYCISPCGTQFLFNKHKNRGRFLFNGAPVKSSLPPFRATQWSPSWMGPVYPNLLLRWTILFPNPLPFPGPTHGCIPKIVSPKNLSKAICCHLFKSRYESYLGPTKTD
jgi:hypothetical protein